MGDPLNHLRVFSWRQAFLEGCYGAVPRDVRVSSAIAEKNVNKMTVPPRVCAEKALRRLVCSCLRTDISSMRPRTGTTMTGHSRIHAWLAVVVSSVLGGFTLAQAGMNSPSPTL